MNNVILKPVGDEYALYADVLARAHPERPVSENKLRLMDSTREADELWGSFFAYVNDVLVGAVGFSKAHVRSEIPTLNFGVNALPEHLDRESQVFEALIDHLRPYAPLMLQVHVREDVPQLAFFTDRGFREYDRMWASTLDLERFDPSPFAWAFDRAAAASIFVKTLAELIAEAEAAGDVEALYRRIYALIVDLLNDVPMTHAPQFWSFETWLERTVKSKDALRDGQFFALKDGELVGVSQLWRSSFPDTIQTGLTGVRASWRRHGIAQMLKLRAAEFAKKAGHRYIRTNNHVINKPMLSINEAMGFEKEPAWISLEKKLEV